VVSSATPTTISSDAHLQFGYPTVIQYSGVAGTKYNLYVDSYNTGIAGKFTIQVTSTPAVCSAQASYGTVTPLGSVGQSYADGSSAAAFVVSQDGDAVQFELYPGFGALAGGLNPGVYTISGDDLNYSTCGLCVLLFGNGSDPYFITGGTVTLTSVNGNLTGTLSNATFQQVTIDSNYVSTPVPGGCQSSITSMPFDTVLVPQ